MPRLLQIDSCLGVLSTGRISEGIASVAINSGWECFIAHGARYVGKSVMHSYQVESKIGEYLHYSKSLLLDSHGLGSERATRRLIHWIDTVVKPDIVQLHCIHGYYLNYKILFEYLNSKSVPVVWTFHDCWAFTGHCAHFVAENCFKWRDGGCKECMLTRSYPKALKDSSETNYALKKGLFATSSRLHIVAVSEWMASLVRVSFLREKSLSIIKNGVDLHSFYPCSSKKNKPVILGVASVWGNDKGLSDFYRLRELLPLDEYDIKLVGLTQSQISQLPKGIDGIGRTDSVRALAEIYSESTVLVNPTYADTFPTVNLEALACGTPVITYDTGGSPEAIDELTGVCVPRGNVGEIASAVINLSENRVDIEACRTRAIDLFDRDVCFRRYIDLYSELLNGKI